MCKVHCEHRAADGLCKHPKGANMKPMTAHDFLSDKPQEAVYCNCPCIGKVCNLIDCDMLKCEETSNKKASCGNKCGKTCNKDCNK